MESVPSITEFVPLPEQWKVIRDIRRGYDYNKGTHEVLLSGSVGSSKSLLMAHIIVTHCCENPGAHFGVGRRVYKDLRDTLIQVIRHHCDGDVPALYHGVTGKFTFNNGSVIRPFSWADKHYMKFRSHEFSGFAIEELTENNDKEVYDEIVNRVGRLRHINEKLVICATNPDDPEHWAYKHWQINKSERRHIYFSRTSDNPYLPASYIEQLRENLDPKMYRRMVLGEWLPIRTEVIYHQYEPDHNYRDQSYKIDPKTDIRWCWDFNIGHNKPLSTVFMQKFNGRFHAYKDIVIEGFRTQDMLDEALESGQLDHDVTYIISGDATGKHRDTRSKHSDWDIVEKFLSNARTKKGKPIRFRMDVPISNPKVRYRHNLMNAVLHNTNGDRRLIVYKDAPVTHEGLMLTKLRSGADYVEDDTKSYQHVTTALGYGIVADEQHNNQREITVYGR